MLRAGERLRDAADERFISRRKALLHQRRIAADKIDANRLRSAFKRESVFNRISPLAPQIIAIGVTEIRLLMIGMPNSRSISSPVRTRRSARRVIFS